MKNLRFKPLNFAYLALAFFVLAGTIFEPSTAVLVGACTTAFVIGSLLFLAPGLKGTLRAIQVEIWQNHIEEEIFKNNPFLNFCHRVDDSHINGRAVHIPQSGGSGNVVKNRTTFPATVRKRTDTDVIYLIDEFTTDPVHLPNADTAELSYDKRNSILGEDQDKLIEEVAEETLYNWLQSGSYGDYSATAFPSGNILSTTGDDVIASAPSGTGNRKAATISDLQKMQTFFRQKNRWKEGKMYCMLPPTMLAEIFPADSVITATYMQNVSESERRSGVMMKAQGWNIMSRSSVAILATAGTVKAPGATAAATDDEGAVFWYKEAVEYAMGGVKAFQDLDNPLYYGDIYSFLVRSGGRARRSGYEGIALLKQAKSS